MKVPDRAVSRQVENCTDQRTWFANKVAMAIASTRGQRRNDPGVSLGTVEQPRTEPRICLWGKLADPPGSDILFETSRHSLAVGETLESVETPRNFWGRPLAMFHTLNADDTPRISVLK